MYLICLHCNKSNNQFLLKYIEGTLKSLFVRNVHISISTFIISTLLIVVQARNLLVIIKIMLFQATTHIQEF